MMLDVLKNLESVGCSKLTTVVHLGAGGCSELDFFVKLGADRICLVEANPEAAKGLRQKTRGLDQVEVIDLAVSPKEGSQPFFVVNNSRESSLSRPAGLLSAFPNLRLAHELTVPATTLEAILKRAGLDDDRENLLLMEVQGQESAILNTTHPDALRKFTWIAVRASRNSLYIGGATLSEIDATMAGLGFESVARSGDGDRAPFLENLYRRNPDKVKLARLMAALTNAEDSLASVKSERDALVPFQRRVQELEERLSAREDERKAQADRVKALEEQVINSAALLAKAEAECARQKEALAQQAHASDEQRAQYDKLRVTTDQLGAEQQASLRKISALEQERQTVVAQLAEAGTRLDAMQSELAELVQSRQRAVALEGQLIACERERNAQADRAKALEEKAIAGAVRLAMVETECARHKEALAQQAGASEAQRAQYEQLCASTEQLAAEHQASLEKISTIERARETLVTQLADAGTRLDSMQSELAELDQCRQRAVALEGKLSSREKECGAQAERIKALEDQVVGCAAKLAKEEAECGRQKEALALHMRAGYEQRAQYDQLRATADQLATEREELLRKVSALEQERQVLLNRETDAGNRLEALQSRIDALAPFQERATTLEQESAAFRKERDALAAQANVARQERDELRQQADSANRSLSESRAENQRLAAALAAEGERKNALQQRVDELTKEAGARQEDLRQARQTASLATKLQTLREADLVDLQRRYEAGQAVQSTQHQLLLQLEEKLRVAAQYFHQLQIESPEQASLPPAKKAASRRAAIPKSASGAKRE